MQSHIESVMADIINSFVKRKDEFILSIYKKQPDFVSLEESKDFIDVKEIYNQSGLKETIYFFKEKLILTIYPETYSEKEGQRFINFNYFEPPQESFSTPNKTVTAIDMHVPNININKKPTT